MFTHSRREISLNGTWKFNPDPYQRCRQQQWWKNLASDASFFPCWDVEGLWDIEVPGTWKTQFPELTWYDGHANYVKDFSVPSLAADQEAFLVFDGIVYASEVYLNGHKVGQHDWGYSPFSCRVTEYLRENNRLFVLVDNHLSADACPACGSTGTTTAASSTPSSWSSPPASTLRTSAPPPGWKGATRSLRSTSTSPAVIWRPPRT